MLQLAAQANDERSLAMFLLALLVPVISCRPCLHHPTLQLVMTLRSDRRSVCR
jgi:hypothetical protein